MVGGDPVDRHVADVVPVPGIFCTRISEADEEFHGQIPAIGLRAYYVIETSATMTPLAGNMSAGEAKTGSERYFPSGSARSSQLEKFCPRPAARDKVDLAGYKRNGGIQ